MNVKLYHFPGTRSARVSWLARELAPDVSLEIEIVDLYGAEQFRPAFADRFPLHAVPAAEITSSDGSTVVLTESSAIVLALADAFPERGLAPSPVGLTAQRADYLRMVSACAASFDMILWQIRLHRHLLGDDQRDERTERRYVEKFEREVEPFLAARVATNGYASGEHFTAADCMIGHLVLWARAYGLCKSKEFAGYLSRLSKRTAFRDAFADAASFDPALPSGSPIHRLPMG